MQSCQKHNFQLRSALAFWSAGLATFSIVGFSRTLPELVHVLVNGGVEESVCSTSYLTTNKVSKNKTSRINSNKKRKLEKQQQKVPAKKNKKQLTADVKGLRPLDLALHRLQDSRVGRHRLHCFAEAETDLPSLVNISGLLPKAQHQTL